MCSRMSFCWHSPNKAAGLCHAAAVVPSDPDPCLYDLPSGGDPARQLSKAKVALLNRPSRLTLTCVCMTCPQAVTRPGSSVRLRSPC